MKQLTASFDIDSHDSISRAQTQQISLPIYVYIINHISGSSFIENTNVNKTVFKIYNHWLWVDIQDQRWNIVSNMYVCKIVSNMYVCKIIRGNEIKMQNHLDSNCTGFKMQITNLLLTLKSWNLLFKKNKNWWKKP